MKSRILQFTLSLCFACAITTLFAHSVNAQSPKVEPEIKQYVEGKAKKANVPADIANVARGDLNGDGKEDVVIEYYIQIGYPGNMTNTYLTVFLNKDAKMNFVTETSALVVPTKIENGVLFCDKYGEGGKKFDKVGTIKYKLVKRKLIEIKDKK